MTPGDYIMMNALPRKEFSGEKGKGSFLGGYGNSLWMPGAREDVESKETMGEGEAERAKCWKV